MIASDLTSSSVNLFLPENTSQIKLIKDRNSIRLRDFSINEAIPVTLYNKMLTFGGSNKSFKLEGDFFNR